MKSEVVITLIFIVIFSIIISNVLSSVIFVLISLRLVIICLIQSAFLSVVSSAHLRAKACLRLTHLIELGVSIILAIILKYLILLILKVLHLQSFNDLLLVLSPLHVLHVVHVKLILQVVNIGVLLHIGGIETLQLSLKALILLLELWLHILNTLQSLVSSLQL